MSDLDQRTKAGTQRHGGTARINEQGIAVAGLVGFGFAWWCAPIWKHQIVGMQLLVVAVSTILPMILWSVFRARTYLNESSGLSPFARSPDYRRVGTKYIGLLLTLSILGAAYWVFPEYSRPRYQPVWELVALAGVPTLLAAWFYMLWVDERMLDPCDGYWHTGRLVLGKWQLVDWVCLREHALGWLIKGFFFPFMFSALAGHLGSVSENGWNPARFDQLYLSTLALIYCVDTLYGAVGYLLTLRILDSQIRSVQPHFFGWAVALICYAPFSAALSSFQSSRSDQDWSTVFSGQPILYITWGFVILLLLTVYVWSTVSFGCRFSNLTNRGIITTGPYRWMKHPAYLSKNIAWWLIAIPFCASPHWQDNLRACVMLSSVNLVYFFRAKTEETHLMADRDYRIYARWVDQFGLCASIRKCFRLLSRRGACHPLPSLTRRGQ